MCHGSREPAALLTAADMLVAVHKDLIEDSNIMVALAIVGVRVLRVEQFLAEIEAPNGT